ncbi:MAG: TonB-dependent receptor [Bacteroidales bacterium]|nr:TonB-dependent receptor [Bacteroidales bacterium]
MRKYIIAILLIATNTIIYAQNSIQGNVKNKTNLENIVGATVYIPELEKGTYSDNKGNFILDNLPEGDFTIKFSFIGYKTQIVRVLLKKKMTKKINIDLQPIHYEANEAIITAAGYTSQHHYAIKVESIGIDEISTGSNINIMDKLDEIPGLNMISQGPGISTPNIRGLSLSNVLVLTDGFRMNNFQFSENHPYLVSNYGINKVELIKGPASLLYGADAVGGVLNFISEKPASVNKIEADFNTNYYSNTNGYQSNIGVKAHGKKLYWGIRAGMQQHHDYRQGGGHNVVNSRFGDKNISINTGINSKIGNYKLSYLYKNSKIGLANTPAKILVTDNGFENKYFYQHLDFHMIKSQNKFYIGKNKLQANFAYQSNRRRLFTKDIYAVDMKLQGFDYELKASRILHDISKTNDSKIIFGMQGHYTQNSIGDAPKVVIPNYYQNDISLFSLLQHDFGKRLHLQAGIRYDYRHIYIPSISSTEYGIIDIDTSYNNISYTLGGTFEITHNIFFRANLASAFRTANIAELTQDGIHGTRYERGNPNLKSQNSNEIDMGIHYHNSKFSFDLAGFYNKIDNYIFLAPTTDTTTTGMTIYKYGQTNSTLYGLETGFNYVPITHIELRANYAYTIGKQANGEYLPFIPQNKINIGIKYEFVNLPKLKNTNIEISSVYAFSKDNISPFEDKSDSYLLVNASVSTVIMVGKQKVKLGIYSKNIFDIKYMDHLSTLREVGYYNMGRNISIQLSIPIVGNYKG